MTFQAPKVIPNLDPEANRQLIAALQQISRDLGDLAEPKVLTAVQTTDYTALLGELVRTNPPSTSMRVLLPQGNSTNQGLRVGVAVLSVASSGTVIVSVAGGTQTVDAAATKTLSTVGIVEFVSLGENGWESLGIGTTAGGGGADWSTTLGLGAHSGAHTPIIDAGQALNFAVGATGITASGALTVNVTNVFELDSTDAHIHPTGALHLGHEGFTLSIHQGCLGTWDSVCDIFSLQTGNGITQSAGTTFTLSTGATNRLAISAAGEWTVPTGGALGRVLTHQGAGTPPIWAAPAGGSVSFTDATITLPFANKQSDTVTVVDGTIVATDKLLVNWGTTLQTDENHPELDDVGFVASAGTGLLVVRVSTTTPSEYVGGVYKIRYLKG